MKIKNREEQLRNWMREHGFAAFVIPSTDPHCGEYVPEHWEVRKWISGFTGSAGTAVITLSEAALWTDSRYFIQAADQLSGTDYLLMKERLPQTPSIGTWLLSVLPTGSKIAICGEMFAHQERQNLAEEVGGLLEVVSVDDIFLTLWEDRPSLPEAPIYEQPLEFAGETVESKLLRIRQMLKEEAVDSILLSALDEVAWATNLRGSDVHCNPVFVGYLLIQPQQATLYAPLHKISEKLRSHLAEQGIESQDYQQVFTDIRSLQSIWIDPASTNQAIYESLSTTPLEKKSPVAFMKSVKNASEIEGFRRSMLRDGVAMVKFLKWLKPAVQAGGQTELTISDKLEAFRAEQPHYMDISFDTISAYGAHGAIVHYEPTPETDIPVKPEGFLLLDSGAQYLDGTTDITRTIPLGPITQEMMLDYTLVLKGFIQLGMAVFPQGTCGTQLDVLARQAMWKAGKNYGHGTGHGVGSHLCVHEGPHQIRMNHMPAVLKAGMTVTDEPGLYLEGRYGIRTENTLLIVPGIETPFGSFLQFEHLTLCPIDQEPILVSLLSPEEIAWLNAYHQSVYEKLSPYLNIEEQTWLKEATKPLS